MTRLPALGPRGEGWFVVQFALLVAVVAAGSAGPAWGGGLRLASSAAGAVALLGGGLLAVRGIVDLRASITPFPRPPAEARLVDTGAYGFVRHPIYGGLVVGAIGWGLLKASPLALVLTVVLLAFLDLKSRREEAWLDERFPAYAGYRRRTRRLIPGVY